MLARCGQQGERKSAQQKSAVLDQLTTARFEWAPLGFVALPSELVFRQRVAACHQVAVVSHFVCLSNVELHRQTDKRTAKEPCSKASRSVNVLRATTQGGPGSSTVVAVKANESTFYTPRLSPIFPNS